MNTQDDISTILKIASQIHTSLVNRALEHGFNSWGPRYRLEWQAGKHGDAEVSYMHDLPRAHALNAHERLSLADLETRTRERLATLAKLIHRLPCFATEEFQLELLDTPADTSGPVPGLQVSVNNTAWPMADGDLDQKLRRLDVFLRQLERIPVDGPLRRFRVNAKDRNRPGLTITASSARSAFLTYAAYLETDPLDGLSDPEGLPEVAEIIDAAYLLEALLETPAETPAETPGADPSA